MTQAVYLLQALSITLALLGDGVVVTALVVLLPGAAGFAINRVRHDAVRDTPLEPHFAWQRRSAIVSLAWLAGTTLVLGPLLFIGLSLLWLAYALVGLWLGWRVARGLWSLQKSRPLPTDVRL
ncbi:MAG: hypothetical protein RLZZ393_2141 [Pseudomonadota bacterium]|jgi:uncharacterized membrane protein